MCECVGARVCTPILRDAVLHLGLAYLAFAQECLLFSPVGFKGSLNQMEVTNI